MNGTGLISFRNRYICEANHNNEGMNVNLTDDERRAFDLYFAHAYQAKVNEQATARARASGGVMLRGRADEDLADAAAETAMHMLKARRQALGDSDI